MFIVEKNHCEITNLDITNMLFVFISHSKVVYRLKRRVWIPYFKASNTINVFNNMGQLFNIKYYDIDNFPLRTKYLYIAFHQLLTGVQINKCSRLASSIVATWRNINIRFALYLHKNGIQYIMLLRQRQ